MSHDPSPTRTLSHATLLALAIPFALAVAMHWPLLFGSFISDDFWWATLLEHDSATANVDWGEILRDFTGPWLGGEVGAFYRPLVTVGFGVNFELGGGSPLSFHAWNLAQHACSSTLCALICALCCTARPALAACVGGSLFALHPAAVEPVGWASCATSTQEVFFRLAAITAYAWTLSTGSRRAYLASLVLAAATLFTKESGLMLPVSLAVLHLLHPARPGLGKSLLLWLPHVLLGIGYLAVRWVVPGLYVTTGNSIGTMLGELGSTLPSKFEALAFPFYLNGASYEQPGFWAMSALLLAVALASWRRRGRAVAIGLAWLFVLFLPSSSFPVLPTYFGARMVYGAVSALALIVSYTLFAHDEKLAWVKAAVAASAIAGLALVARTRIEHYERASDDMDRFRAELARQARDASPGAPLALLTVAPEKDGILRIAPGVAFAVAEQPHSPENVPLVSLAAVLERVPEFAALHLDAAPLRALYELGAKILTWDDTRRSFLTERRPTEPVVVPKLARAREGLRWNFASPAPTWAVEGVALELPRAVSGKVRWLTSNGAATGEIRFPAGRSVTLDLSHDLVFLTARFVGLTGFEIVPDEPLEPSDDTLTMRTITRLATLPLREELADRQVVYEELVDSLRAPDGADRLVLMTPSVACPIPVTSGRVELSNEVRLHLEWLMRSSREKRCYYYFERRGTRPARSLTDRFRLTRRGPRRRWKSPSDDGLSR